MGAPTALPQFAPVTRMRSAAPATHQCPLWAVSVLRARACFIQHVHDHQQGPWELGPFSSPFCSVAALSGVIHR